MLRLRSQPGVFLIVAVLALAMGCAKRPVGSESKPAGTSAPAPTVAVPPPPEPSVVQESSSSSATAGGRATDVPIPATPPPAGGGRPSPSEFRDSEALKDIYFDFDKANIRPDAATTLMANAAWMKENPRSSILIEGHCDERGTTEYNLALGQRRAQSARDFLVSQGIPGGRIAMISYGKERPSCTESTESCWARNRRAHFLVKPS